MGLVVYLGDLMAHEEPPLLPPPSIKRVVSYCISVAQKRSIFAVPSMISTECASLEPSKVENHTSNHKPSWGLPAHSNTGKELVLKKIVIDQINQNIAFFS